MHAVLGDWKRDLERDKEDFEAQAKRVAAFDDQLRQSNEVSIGWIVTRKVFVGYLDMLQSLIPASKQRKKIISVLYRHSLVMYTHVFLCFFFDRKWNNSVKRLQSTTFLGRWPKKMWRP